MYLEGLYLDLEMSSADLKILQRELLEFQETQWLKNVLTYDYESALEAARSELEEMVPATIQQQNAREQLIGQIQQIKIVLDWFEARNEEIERILKNDKTD